MAACQAQDELVQDEVVAPDVPRRLQADPVVDEADAARAGHVVVVEATAEQPLPVDRLGLGQTFLVRADELLETRLRPEMLVEAPDDPG